MTADEASVGGLPTAWQATAWTCSLCGHCNLLAEACEACGVARRFLDDPPLDLPHTPRLTALPSFWIGLLWGGATLVGLLALLSPPLRATLGPGFLLAEVAAAGAAAVSSLFTAQWERLFNQVELLAPPHAASGSTFEARLRLVPYGPLANVRVELTLVDRFYRQQELAAKALESRTLLTDGRLPGRRATQLSASFLAPYPITAHSSVQAEMAADLVGFLAYFVPALRFSAANLREHGGYYLEARVRVGLLSRRYHRRVITYAMGRDIHVG